MKEPHFKNYATGEQVPYSQAPTEWLSNLEGSVGPNQEEFDAGHWDRDFRHWYAAYILQSRGQ